MTDPATYSRYSIPLEQKMFELEDLLRDFLRTIETYSGSSDQKFIAEARVLGTELAGRPGDAALEVYNDLERDLSHTRSFIQRWAGAEAGTTADVLQAAIRVGDGLRQMHALVQSTPPEIMEEIKSSIRSYRAATRTGSRKKDVVLLLGFVLVGGCLLEGGISELNMLYAMMYAVSCAPLLSWWKRRRQEWAFDLWFVLTIATALSMRILS